MGMNFSPMYQPVSTKTIKADGDLNINPYDLLATDVKCDTVEADEFVGGVGNFSSGLFSGNLQLDGNLIIEGSINNVNIDDNGVITANGYNIGTAETFPYSPSAETVSINNCYLILPPLFGKVYSGTMTISLPNNGTYSFAFYNGTEYIMNTGKVGAGTSLNIQIPDNTILAYAGGSFSVTLPKF